MTEDEPLTLPAMEWIYREEPEPSWRAEKYVISVVSAAAEDLIFSPYIIRFGLLRHGTSAWSMPSGTG